MIASESSLLGKLMRFALVGVVVTGSYSAVAYVLIDWFVMHPMLASLAACAVAIAVSYLGQKYFTFRSAGGHGLELPKFLVACVVAVVGSTASLGAITHAGLDFRIGILVAALVLPLCNFTVMNLWVFAQPASGAAVHGK